MKAQQHIELEIPSEIVTNWQTIVDVVAKLVNVPAALIMRYAAPDIEVFTSSESIGNPYKAGDREVFENSGLYCETVIKTNAQLLIPDALSDENWKTNPDVKLNMISYLGVPISLPDSSPFGTICVLDNKPNHYSPSYQTLILQFRDLIESHLSMAYMNQMLGDKNRQLQDYFTELKVLRGLVPICSSCKSIRDDNNNWHPVEEYLYRNPEVRFSHGICPTCKDKLYPELSSN